MRGFLVLSDLEGTPLAAGDLGQVVVGDRVTSRLVFRFKDGSLHDETVVFSFNGLTEAARQLKVLETYIGKTRRNWF